MKFYIETDCDIYLTANILGNRNEIARAIAVTVELLLRKWIKEIIGSFSRDNGASVCEKSGQDRISPCNTGPLLNYTFAGRAHAAL